MQFRVVATAFAELPCRTRMPFRFGAVTVDSAPLLHAMLRIETVDGRSAVGIASDLLVPKWFRKDTDRAPEHDQQALVASAEAAAQEFRAHGFLPAFAHWQRVHEQRVESQPPRAGDLLERGFGVALCERAAIDAVCRVADKSFWSALQCDLFQQQPQFEGGRHGRAFAELLPDQPLRRILVRHTVGMLDPLRARDIPAAERLDDGMPQALDEVLGRHGVHWLKVKIGAGRDQDRARLLAIGALLDELAVDVQVTLDGNEQFADYAQLRELWRAAADDPAGRSLLQRVRWVEQPLPCAAKTPSTESAHVLNWPFCPLVLDEGDTQLRSLRSSNYDGVSVKNCKGVFRAFANRELVHASNGARFQTSEDLTNLPVVALQQDLTTAAVLGLTHSERNGHHYFPGLDHLPAEVTAAALDAHADLYEPTATGARLRIDGGAIACGSLLGPGYGCDQQVVQALQRTLPWRAIG